MLAEVVCMEHRDQSHLRYVRVQGRGRKMQIRRERRTEVVIDRKRPLDLTVLRANDKIILQITKSGNEHVGVIDLYFNSKEIAGQLGEMLMIAAKEWEREEERCLRKKTD